jgi:hypothetical protein
MTETGETFSFDEPVAAVMKQRKRNKKAEQKK